MANSWSYEPLAAAPSRPSALSLGTRAAPTMWDSKYYLNPSPRGGGLARVA